MSEKYPDLGFMSKYSKLGFVIRHRYSNEEQNLRKFLRERRLKVKLKQADLAGRLGVPQSFVSKYESGERLLTFVEVLLILDQLGATIKDAAKSTKPSIDETKS